LLVFLFPFLLSLLWLSLQLLLPSPQVPEQMAAVLRVVPAGQPAAHAGQDHGHQAERRRVVVGPRVMADAPVHGLVRVAGALGAELPDSPIIAVLLIQEGYQAVERVAVRALRVCLRRARSVFLGGEGRERGQKKEKSVSRAEELGKQGRGEVANDRCEEEGGNSRSTHVTIMLEVT